MDVVVDYALHLPFDVDVDVDAAVVIVVVVFIGGDFEDFNLFHCCKVSSACFIQYPLRRVEATHIHTRLRRAKIESLPSNQYS